VSTSTTKDRSNFKSNSNTNTNKVMDMALEINKNSPIGLRLASRLFIELGRPPQFHNAKALLSWSPRMESVLAKSGLDYERFKWFLVWVCRLRGADGANYGNDYTATYLRAARDPVATLAKHFNKVFFTFFLPEADKRIPMLMEKRQREDEENAARQPTEPENRLRYIDLLDKWVKLYLLVDEHGVAGERGVASIRMRLEFLDKIEDAFPMLQPFPGESMEEWIDREFELLRDDNWRCKDCTYAFSIDGGDESRIKLCADCDSERILWAQDDLEWMHDGETESVWTPLEWGTVPLDHLDGGWPGSD